MILHQFEVCWLDQYDNAHRALRALEQSMARMGRCIVVRTRVHTEYLGNFNRMMFTLDIFFWAEE